MTWVRQADAVVHRCDRPQPGAYHDMWQCSDCGRWWMTVDGDYGGRWVPISDRKAVRMIHRIEKSRERSLANYEQRKARKKAP